MKRLVSIVLAIVLVLSLTACTPTSTQPSTSESSSPVSSEAASSAIVSPAATTTFWSDSPFVEGAFVAATQAFMKDNPNYTITVEVFPGADRPQKLALAKQAGTLPSVFFTASFTSMDEVHQGSILPINDMVSLYKDDIDESILNQIKVGEDFYMLPIYTSSQGMLYNADYFKAAGLEKYVPEDKLEIATWKLSDYENEILPKLKALFAGTEKYPMALFAGNEQNDSYLHNLLRMYGGEVIKDGKVVAGNDANTIKALDKLGEWCAEGYTNSDAATKVTTDCNSDFQNQKSAISSGQLSTYNNYLAAFDKGTSPAFDLRIATVPRITADGKDSGSIHAYIYGLALMNVKEDQQILAKDFMTWLSTQKEGSLKDLDLLGMPACNSIIESVKADKPIFGSYQKVSQYMFDFTGGAPGYVSTRSLFFPALQSKLSGKQSSKDALSNYTTKANEIIDEFSSKSVVLSK